MNALELADDAKNIHTTIEALEWVQRAVPLLRQFHAEIEALKLRELTDEEIWDWFKENTALTKESALMIARAILKKASEK